MAWCVRLSVSFVVRLPLPAFGHPPRGELGEGFDWGLSVGAGRLYTLHEPGVDWGLSVGFVRVEWWVLLSVSLVVSQPLPAVGHPHRGELGEGFDWRLCVGPGCLETLHDPSRP